MLKPEDCQPGTIIQHVAGTPLIEVTVSYRRLLREVLHGSTHYPEQTRFEVAEPCDTCTRTGNHNVYPIIENTAIQLSTIPYTEVLYKDEFEQCEIVSQPKESS